MMNKLLTSSPQNPYNSHETINIGILKVSLPIGQFHITVAQNNPGIIQQEKGIYRYDSTHWKFD